MFKIDQYGTGYGGRGRPKEEGRELKKRISLSVLPSLYEDIQKIAYVQRCSVSELIGELLEDYRAEHEAEIQGYRDIKKVKFDGGNRRLPKCKQRAVYI